MEELIGWVRNLVFYMVFLTLVLNLLPAGRYEKYVRLFAGTVLVLVAVRPFTSSLRLDEKISYYFQVFSYREEAADFERQLEEMEEKRLDELTERYEEEAEEAVRKMAEEAGMEPEAVEVTIGRDREKDSFGKITAVRVLDEKEEDSGRIAVGRIRPVEPVGPEESKGRELPAAAAGEAVQAAEEKGGKRAESLRQQIADYYHLEESHVEIQWEHE